MPHARSRLAPDEMRAVALDAARAILIADGPQAVTLMAVAKRINRTHANLLHHFGSADDLRRAMAGMMANRITAAIAAMIVAQRRHDGDIREVVDITFDAFEKEGVAALISWMILSGDRQSLAPILDAVHDMVEQLGEHGGAPFRQLTQMLMLIALGDGMIGTPISEALSIPRETIRATVAHHLRLMRGW